MTITVELNDGRQITLDKEAATIGQGPGADIVVKSPGLNPIHASIVQIAGKWMIESAGDWLLQVDDGVPGRKLWLQSGQMIWLTEAGPRIVFDPPPQARKIVPPTTDLMPPPIPTTSSVDELSASPPELPDHANAFEPTDPSSWAIDSLPPPIPASLPPPCISPLVQSVPAAAPPLSPAGPAPVDEAHHFFSIPIPLIGVVLIGITLCIAVAIVMRDFRKDKNTTPAIATALSTERPPESASGNRTPEDQHHAATPSGGTPVTAEQIGNIRIGMKLYDVTQVLGESLKHEFSSKRIPPPGGWTSLEVSELLQAIHIYRIQGRGDRVLVLVFRGIDIPSADLPLVEKTVELLP
jgi:hypothetical protein